MGLLFYIIIHAHTGNTLGPTVFKNMSTHNIHVHIQDPNSKLFRIEVLRNSAISDAFNSKTIDKHFMCHSTVAPRSLHVSRHYLRGENNKQYQSRFDLMKNWVAPPINFDTQKAITQAMCTNLLCGGTSKWLWRSEDIIKTTAIKDGHTQTRYKDKTTNKHPPYSAGDRRTPLTTLWPLRHDPINHFLVPPRESIINTRVSIPRATLLPGPDQQFQMPSCCGRSCGAFVPSAALLPDPAHGVQMTSACHCSTDMVVQLAT